MSKSHAKYAGPERRHRKVYLTRNTEYHFVDDVCIAVRQRESGQWRVAHAALSRTLTGSVRFTTNGDVHPTSGPPTVGDALFFAAQGTDVITSALTEVSRPSPQTIASYPL